ncbi:hypothetical protein D9Q98_008587 [Chlorella vulgaris]|uniref:Transcription initiation factor IIF subunit alpha n=1 Tax=Chlorella vulgaris TaxID=3077 RepID=A0A9D4YU85_CHLVU|nr:hypothetical protein D9Q98_008587 [Chlorella vulgaris]
MSEFTIRAGGVDRAALKHLVARFPATFKPDPKSDETANAPDLKRPGDSWLMGQMEAEEAKPGTRGMPGQWVLEEQVTGRPRFVGQPEGGMRDTGAGYFLLMKGKGNEFIAVPVADVVTFKPALQRRQQSLEEAEAAMQAQREQHGRANPRLARAIARDGAEADPLTILRDENEADSDEEWKGIKERAAARQVAKAAAAPQQQQPQQARQQQRKQAGAAGGGGEELPGEDHAELSDKGEDWEHEDEAADDDLDMGESDGEPDVGSPIRKGGVSSDSEEEEEEGAPVQPGKAKRRLKRMMRDTGLADSDDEEEEAADREEESESIMDEEDLDRMAGVAGGAGAAAGEAGAAAREPTPETQLRPAAAKEAAAGGKKRKSPTPSPVSPGKPVAAGAAAAAAGTTQGTKRPRTSAAGPAGTAAAAAAASPSAGKPAPAAAAPAAGGSAVTADELRQLLRSKGRILLADLTAMYKSRLTPEGQKQFVLLVRQVARMEPGTKYLVLKE